MNIDCVYFFSIDIHRSIMSAQIVSDLDSADSKSPILAPTHTPPTFNRALTSRNHFVSLSDQSVVNPSMYGLPMTSLALPMSPAAAVVGPQFGGGPYAYSLLPAVVEPVTAAGHVDFGRQLMPTMTLDTLGVNNPTDVRCNSMALKIKGGFTLTTNFAKNSNKYSPY